MSHESTEFADNQFQPILLLGVVTDEVGTPGNDGTQGCALYCVPLQLSQAAPPEWADAFVHAWDHPSRFTSMHRPGIVSVQGDRIVLDGTTLEEVRDYHLPTLKLAAEDANARVAQLYQRRAAEQSNQVRRDEEHRRHSQNIADQISFG